AAEGTRRPEGPRDPHRRRVRCAEGQDPGAVAVLFLLRPRQTWMPYALPRDPRQQNLYNEELNKAYASTRQAPPLDPVAQLKGLGELHASGTLTDDEFAAAKAKVLDQGNRPA